jgi:hypothetical protein
MSYDEDPEVAADIALRERTTWERNPSAGMPAYKPPVVVTHWPCRACKTPVAITEDALEQKAVFDRQLARQDEKPIDSNTIAICDGCQTKRWKLLADRNRERVDNLARAIRELRGGTKFPQPPGPAPQRAREIELVRDVIKFKHPEPDALIKAISDARNQGGRRSKGTL